MKFKKRLVVYSLIVGAGIMWWMQHEINTRVLSPPPKDDIENRFKVVQVNISGNLAKKKLDDSDDNVKVTRLTTKTSPENSASFKNRNSIKNSMSMKDDHAIEQPRKNFLTRERLDKAVNWSSNNKDQHPKQIPFSDKIDVLVIPFSHTDPGWLQTIESYFDEKVENILDLVVKKLTAFNKMTFIWAEIVYLYMWWQKKDEKTRGKFLDLVKSGRLEIVSGSWVMPDEAGTHYSALVSTLYEGHNWLQKELGITVNVTWNVDPFGYSSTMPYLWSLFGMKGTYIQRVSARYKEFLRKNQTLEFNWMQPFDKDGPNTRMLTSVAPYKLYNIEHTCGPVKSVCKLFDFYYDPIMLDLLNEKEQQEKLEKYSQSLLNMLRFKAASYRHKTVLLPIGDDFRYFDTTEWNNHYIGFSALIGYINKHSGRLGATIKYATLSEYFERLKEYSTNSGGVFPSYEGDFLPYADEYFEYWTGYYTTHPKLKQSTRELQSAILAARLVLVSSCKLAKDCTTLASMAAGADLDEASKILGLLQHHDAITGTAPPGTVHDYLTKAMDGLTKTRKALVYAMGAILKDLMKIRVPLVSVPLESPIVAIPNNSIVIFNPLFVERSEVVSLTIGENVELRDLDRKKIPLNYTRTKGNNDPIGVQFLARIPPLSYKIYNFVNTNDRKDKVNPINLRKTLGALPQDPKHETKESFELENDFLQVQFDRSNRVLKAVHKGSSQTFNVNIDAMAYESLNTGGAYLFSPAGDAFSMAVPDVIFTSGSYAGQIELYYPVLKLTIKLFNSTLIRDARARSLDITCHVHVNRDNFRNKELILRLRTDVQNNGTFYTDSNGFQMMKRKFIDKKQINGNYYPMSTTFIIEDKTRRVSLHAGEPHGVASLSPGWMEVMLDRLPQSDDRRGVGQGVFISEPYTARFSLILEAQPTGFMPESPNPVFVQSLVSTQVNDFLQNPVQTFFSNSEMQVRNIPPSRNTGAVLPPDLSLVFITTIVEKNQGAQKLFKIRVVFHRRLIRDSLAPNCIKVEEIFPNKNIQEVHQMDLRFINLTKTLKSSSCLDIPVHILTAFQLVFA